MTEGYLHVWGKNFPQPTQLKQKVILAAAGENHILFTTGTSSSIQHLVKITGSALTALDSSASNNHSSIKNPYPSLKIKG